MRNKKFIFISLLILAIGFAAVSTTLYITGSVAYQTKKSNFDVYFSGAEIDDIDVSNLIIKDKKHIEFMPQELKKLNDSFKLKYEVTNDSTEYDATVTISCTPMKTNYLDIILNPVNFDVEAGKVESGEIEVKLISVSETEQNVSIACELNVLANERTSIETIPEKNDNYAISGILKDSNGNPLSKVYVAAHSTKQVVRTGHDGYFYFENLERGFHKIYYKSNETNYNFSDEELEEYLIAEASTNNYIKIINKNYTIEDYKSGLNLENKTSFCKYDIGYEWNYETTGQHTFELKEDDCDGTYKLEVWGAQGGSYSNVCQGGYGGYSSGIIDVKKGDKLFIGVGGSGSGNGSHTYQYGGWNGGGDATSNGDGNTRQSSGGGATHIAKGTIHRGALVNYINFKNEVLLVAGGGAGGAGNAVIMCVNGGTGGGTSGSDGETYYEDSWSVRGTGGTQSSGGSYYQYNVSSGYSLGSFGTGASTYAVGAGGGWYGGGAIRYSGGGGSGYIGDVKNGNTINGINAGNGHARITLISLNS